jgi:CBS domain-containing protein
MRVKVNPVIGECMTPLPPATEIDHHAFYSVEASTPLTEVAEQMFRHRYGYTIVTDSSGKAVGVFSAADAMKVLQALLRGKAFGIYLQNSHPTEVKPRRWG